MSVTVRIPQAMRTQTGGAAAVELDGETVGDVLRALADAHPGVAPRLLDREGSLRRFVNVFVDDEDIRHAEGLHTRVAPGQRISILPAVAGG